jgi:glycerophosphoryl diester phosphodiesterase
LIELFGEMKRPLIIAHRGASGEFPENTIQAFWEAIKQNADIVELDVQLTLDDQVVVFHDKGVERIFEIRSDKAIRDYKLKELKKLDAGSWFDKSFSDIKIPTLEEVISGLPQNASLIIEIKGNEEKLIYRLLDILDSSRKHLGLGYISVKDTVTHRTIMSATSKHQIGLMQKERTPLEFLNEIRESNISVGQIRWRNWKEEDWLLLKNVEFKVNACCADELNEFAFLCGKAVDGILTNYPSRLTAYLHRMDY